VSALFDHALAHAAPDLLTPRPAAAPAPRATPPAPVVREAGSSRTTSVVVWRGVGGDSGAEPGFYVWCPVCGDADAAPTWVPDTKHGHALLLEVQLEHLGHRRARGWGA